MGITYYVETCVVGLARLALVLANARGGGGDRGGSLVLLGTSTLKHKASKITSGGRGRRVKLKGTIDWKFFRT